jgi:hypothetical protein
VVLAVVPLVLNRGGDTGFDAAGDSRTQAQPTPAAEAAYPPVFDLGSNYDQASMRALAGRLGDQARRTSGKEDTGPSPIGPLSGGASVSLADVPGNDVVRCVLQATGLPTETIPVYLEVATYQGTPAYVAAVLSEGASKDHLRVYTVSRQGCTFLFLADQPL